MSSCVDSLPHKAKHDNGLDILIVGKDSVQRRRRAGTSREGTVQSAEPVVLSSSELQRLKMVSIVPLNAQLDEDKRRSEQKLNEMQEKSRARKAKIQKHDSENQEHYMQCEEEKERRHRNDILQQVQDHKDEQLDDVKQMNQMILYSKVATVREQQVAEARRLQHEREEEEKRLDSQMLKKWQEEQDKTEKAEKKKVEIQRHGADILREQIRERKEASLRDEDQRELELQFMRKQAEALKEEEERHQQIKVKAARALLEEVNKANAAALRAKEEKKMEEQAEEKRIVQYQREKDQRDKQREEELGRIAAAKEADAARLRSMQEKARDKSAEMDVLRAKRATAARERAARKKSQEEKDRLRQINEDLARARLQQQAERERKMADAANVERLEHQEIVRVQRLQEEKDKRRLSTEKERQLRHAAELRLQIEARSQKRQEDQRTILKQGRLVRTEMEKERKKLQKIKEDKLNAVRKEGVLEKFLAELALKKISF